MAVPAALAPAATRRPAPDGLRADSGREPEARKREAQESPGREDQSAESRTRRLGQHGRKTRPQTGRQGQLLAAAGPGSAAAGPPSQCLPACEPGGAGDTYSVVLSTALARRASGHGYVG